MKQLLILALLPLAPVLAAGQSTPATAAVSAAHAIVETPATIEWQAAPTSLPPGAKAVVLEGDPTRAGPFTMRLLLPDGYRIPPHFHDSQERVTIVSGIFVVGMGNEFDAAATTELPAGTYASVPPGMAHFALARGETVV